MAFDQLQYRALKRFAPAAPQTTDPSTYEGKSKIAVCLGPEILQSIQGKTVIDFGCGDGTATLDLARHGAKQVIGLDILQHALDKATRHAQAAGFTDRCLFSTRTDTKADIIISLDAFEHFGDPAAILRTMHALLAPGGFVIASFGPTWFHPLGGHLFSVFPWSHLLFSESALLHWRSDMRHDGATRFSEVEGGLNQMTIKRFERIVSASGFKVEQLEAVPIRALRPIHCKLTREFSTAIVRAKLVTK